MGTCLLHLDSGHAGRWGPEEAGQAGSGAEPPPTGHQVAPILHPVLPRARLAVGRADG